LLTRGVPAFCNHYRYIAEWVAAAKRVHNVTVHYVGFQNESPWQPEWVVGLREALDVRGLHDTRVVIGDCGCVVSPFRAGLDRIESCEQCRRLASGTSWRKTQSTHGQLMAPSRAAWGFPTDQTLFGPSGFRHKEGPPKCMTTLCSKNLLCSTGEKTGLAPASNLQGLQTKLPQTQPSLLQPTWLAFITPFQSCRWRKNQVLAVATCRSTKGCGR
jgi:hypothetical protein